MAISDHEEVKKNQSKKEMIADLVKRLEGGLVPDEEMKNLFRFECEKRLQWGYKSTHQEQLSEILNFAQSIKKMKIAMEMDDFNAEMYEIPIPFLQIKLGPSLKESCHYFKDESTTLEEAEIASMELYLEMAQIQDGQTILDLGCGLGPLSFYIAQKYTNCKVTAVTNSLTHKKFVENKSKTLNIQNVEVILADVTTHEMATTFDRLFAIGLIEHMQNYELFLRKLSKWMKEDSLLLIEHLCHKTFPYHYAPIDEDDWYTTLLYPAGTVLSASFLLYFQDDLSVVNHWSMSGKNVSRTTEEWLKRIDANKDEIVEIFEAITNNKEEVAKVINHWRLLCISSMEMFGYNDGEEWMVSQVLFKKKYIDQN